MLLENVARHHAVIDAYEVERDFFGMGRRTMLLNARKVFDEDNFHTTTLLTIEDITEQRAKERELKELLQRKDVLLKEIQHRVANSMQIVAGVLLSKARTVLSKETRLHLHDAHQRIMSVAAVQQQLQISEAGTTVEIGPYLSRLCETLAASMIGAHGPIALKVHAKGGTASSSQAVSVGLIVAELVTNALKHAFPRIRSNACVIVAYDLAGPNWSLTVDNGIGRPVGRLGKTKPGLGMTIIETLAKQLDARLEVLMGPHGTTVSITHAPFTSLRRSPSLSAYVAGFTERSGRRRCNRGQLSLAPVCCESTALGNGR